MSRQGGGGGTGLLSAKFFVLSSRASEEEIPTVRCAEQVQLRSSGPSVVEAYGLTGQHGNPHGIGSESVPMAKSRDDNDSGRFVSCEKRTTCLFS